MAALPVAVIRADAHGASYLREAWSRRRLLWFFARRDLVVRYRQTVLGVLWVLLKPALATGVFTIIFGKVANLERVGGAPYPVLVLSGMLAWNWFASSLSEGSHILVNNPNLITKVWFPRVLLPLASLLLNLVDLAVGLLFLVVVLACYGKTPALTAPLAIIPLLAMGAFALGGALWAGALMVRFRDVRAVVPVVLTYAFLFSPVAFSGHAAPAFWQAWIWAVPLAAPIEAVRALLIGTPLPPLWACCWSAGCALAVLISGYFFFRHWEDVFADVL